jgi:hypothetical protein
MFSIHLFSLHGRIIFGTAVLKKSHNRTFLTPSKVYTARPRHRKHFDSGVGDNFHSLLFPLKFFSYKTCCVSRPPRSKNTKPPVYRSRLPKASRGIYIASARAIYGGSLTLLHIVQLLKWSRTCSRRLNMSALYRSCLQPSTK